MRVKVVTLRYAPSLGGFDERPLSDFVRDKEVLAVREHFFTVHELPHLACLITYQASTVAAPTPAAGNEKRARKGQRSGNLDALLADLTEEERVLFGTLREWRAARARKDGVPPYVVFTNKELLAVVKAKPQTPNALGSLEGIGAGKVKRYGTAVLQRLHGTPPESVKKAPENPGGRVARGGSRSSAARAARSADRINAGPSAFSDLGFRLARPVTP